MKLSISEAARRAGVRRNTLYRKIEAGKLSKETDEDGKPVIDLGELARVYPRAVTAPIQTPSEQKGTTPNSDAQTLRELIVVLSNDKDRLIGELEQERKARAADAERSRDERERMLSLLETAQRQLTDLRPVPTEQPAPAPRRNWLARLVGA